MLHPRTGIICLCACLLLLSSAACDKFGVAGAAKYKVDLTNILMNILDEIKTKGEVTDNTQKKLESFMAKSEAEFGKAGSYVRAKRVVESIQEAKSSSGSAFRAYKQAEIEITEILELLKTEVDRAK